MKISVYLSLLCAGLCSTALPQTTHDDPIIIKGGSVILNFGFATKAFNGSGLWASNVGGKFLYYQHTHMDASHAHRVLQALGTGSSAVNAPSSNRLERPMTKSLFSRTLDTPGQRGTRIEIFLKGVPLSGGPEVTLPNGPQIVLEAVDMAATTGPQNPNGYQGVPCCAHPNFSRLGPGAANPVPNYVPSLPAGLRELCSRIEYKPSTDAKTLTWAWRVVSNRPLIEKATTDQMSASKRHMLEARYVDPAYQSVNLDYYNVSARTGPSAVFTPVTDSAGKPQNKIPFGRCAAMELCAVEPLNGVSCEMKAQACEVFASTPEKAEKKFPK
jgi:hypothetical protein